MIPRAALALTLLLMAGGAAADQTDARLPGLFAELAHATGEQQAQLAVLRIWQIWYETSVPQAQELVEAGEREVARGRYDDALALYDRLVAVAPNFAEGWNRRATVLYLMGNFAASIADCETVLRLEPRHFGAWSGLAEMLRARGEDAPALVAYEKLLALNPTLGATRASIEELRTKLKGRAL